LNPTKNRPRAAFGLEKSEFGFFFAFLHPAFTAANAPVAAFAAMIAKCGIARTSILLVLQRHAANFALVKFLVRISKHILIFTLQKPLLP
jgi:hypothetical protein